MRHSKQRYSFIIAFLLFALAGCASGEAVPKDGPFAYQLNHSENRIEGRSIQIQGKTAGEQVENLLDELTQADSGCKAPLDMGFAILDWSMDKGKITLNLSQEYSTLPGITEVLVRAAVVKTLLQAQDAESVEMLVEGEPLLDSAGELVGSMNQNTFIQNDGNEINTYELVKVKLYFTNETADKLLAANREKHYSTNTPLERFVVEELIAGPSGQVEGLFPTISPETKVINVMTTDGICYVNLDASFLTPVNNASLELAAHSVANSLLELNNISQVQILVGGEIPESLMGVNFTREEDAK